MTTNALGYRGPGFPLVKRPGEFRILFTGDSFAYGDFVNDDQTLPAQLEQRLNGRCGTVRVVKPTVVMGSLLASYAGTVLAGAGTSGVVLGVGLALVLGFVGTAAAAAMIYRIFPPERMDRRSILRGTVWSAATISLLSLAFTAVVGASSNVSEHYGTGGVALVVMLAIWMFLANALLLTGYRIALDS